MRISENDKHNIIITAMSRASAVQDHMIRVQLATIEKANAAALIAAKGMVDAGVAALKSLECAEIESAEGLR